MKRALALGALLLATACRDDDDARLVVVITALGSPPGVVALEVKLTGPGGMSTNSYNRDGQEPISFPTTLSAQLPKHATGDVTIDVEAKDATGRMVASGQKAVTVRPGQTLTVYVRLECVGGGCVVDAGVVDTDGGIPMPSPRCGNGRVDPGETCDTAIPAGAPGACPPPDCDDHVPCTKDMPTGSGCTAKCDHGDKQEIRQRLLDGCCPAGSSYLGEDNMDMDCSPTCGDKVVDPNETCDTGIARGMAGACPTECRPAAACEQAKLVSAFTCSAVCVRYQIVETTGKLLDGCCPPGATNAVDSDCAALCGNGVVDDGERCDVGLPLSSPDACPTSCADDDPCTMDYFSNIGCQFACQNPAITIPVSGDGCCLPGSNQTQDSDCPARCGNGILERGETCDPTASCPTSCAEPPDAPVQKKPGCLSVELVGDKDDCTARCVMKEITACGPNDLCCPSGCTSANDADCSSLCGNGFFEPSLGEECEINAPPLELARCKTSCADSNPCTEDRMVSAGTCAARCVPLPITALRAGDGCCPPAAGGNAMLDPDCTPTCGNGVVEQPSEVCDWGAGGSCPAPEACPSNAYCTPYVLRGSAGTCNAACVAMPIIGCANGDSCCPPGCSTADDSDCQPICGNGVVDSDENCDRAITAGHQGACLSTCDDANACTIDIASGSAAGCTRACIHQPVTACLAGDGCCPPGCAGDNDADCTPRCTDGRVGAGETCDPPSSCPTSCPDDGDPCTAEQLSGEAASCNVTCRHVPITSCVAAAGDACCPTGCTPANDWDC